MGALGVWQRMGCASQNTDNLREMFGRERGRYLDISYEGQPRHPHSAADTTQDLFDTSAPFLGGWRLDGIS